MPKQKQQPTPAAKKQANPASAPIHPAASHRRSLAAVPPAVINAAAAYAGVAIKPAAYDPAAAQAALDALRPRLMAPPKEQLSIPRLDIRAAALAVLGVHAFVTQVPGVEARFNKVSSIGEFDMANVEDLKALAFGILYVHAQAEKAGAFRTDAKVPAKLVAEGIEVEARMQELCEYKFKRHEKIAPLLDLLRPGSGYRDLAGDLNGYADIYEMEPAEVASDTTNYRATDVDDARRIAGEIMSCLSAAMSPEAREASELLSRLWTVLRDVYFEVREVGLVLLRHDPDADDWFPSLFTAGRPGRQKKQGKKQVENDQGKDATGNG